MKAAKTVKKSPAKKPTKKPAGDDNIRAQVVRDLRGEPDEELSNDAHDAVRGIEQVMRVLGGTPQAKILQRALEICDIVAYVAENPEEFDYDA